MEQMPDFKEGFITLWRGGKWVQIPTTDLPKIIEEDNREPENGNDVPPRF